MRTALHRCALARSSIPDVEWLRFLAPTDELLYRSTVFWTHLAVPGKFELKRLCYGKRIAAPCRDLLSYFCSTFSGSALPCGPSSSPCPMTPSPPWIPC